jgi:hypothetical protein
MWRNCRSGVQFPQLGVVGRGPKWASRNKTGAARKMSRLEASVVDEGLPLALELRYPKTKVESK